MQNKPPFDCAVVGIGTDIADVARIKSLIEKYGNAFLEKTFTAAEIAYCLSKADAPLHFAARFAAKEAMAKALARASTTPLHSKACRSKTTNSARLSPCST